MDYLENQYAATSTVLKYRKQAGLMQKVGAEWYLNVFKVFSYQSFLNLTSDEVFLLFISDGLVKTKGKVYSFLGKNFA